MPLGACFPPHQGLGRWNRALHRRQKSTGLPVTEGSRSTIPCKFSGGPSGEDSSLLEAYFPFFRALFLRHSRRVPALTPSGKTPGLYDREEQWALLPEIGPMAETYPSAGTSYKTTRGTGCTTGVLKGMPFFAAFSESILLQTQISAQPIHGSKHPIRRPAPSNSHRFHDKPSDQTTAPCQTKWFSTETNLVFQILFD